MTRYYALGPLLAQRVYLALCRSRDADEVIETLLGESEISAARVKALAAQAQAACAAKGEETEARALRTISELPREEKIKRLKDLRLDFMREASSHGSVPVLPQPAAAVLEPDGTAWEETDDEQLNAACAALTRVLAEYAAAGTVVSAAQPDWTDLPEITPDERIMFFVAAAFGAKAEGKLPEDLNDMPEEMLAYTVCVFAEAEDLRMSLREGDVAEGVWNAVTSLFAAAFSIWLFSYEIYFFGALFAVYAVMYVSMSSEAFFPAGISETAIGRSVLSFLKNTKAKLSADWNAPAIEEWEPCEEDCCAGSPWDWDYPIP